MDFLNDNNPRLLKQASTLLEDLPDYIEALEASDNVKTACEGLDTSCFADPYLREYPINDKQNTYLSYAYFKSAGCKDKEIHSRLVKAAELHSITSDLCKIDAVYKKKKASKEEVSKSFALSVDYGDEGPRYYYPMVDTLSLEKSARELAEDFDKMPIEAFRHASKNIVKAASKLGMGLETLPSRVRNTGHDGEFNTKAAAIAVRQREELVGKEAASVYLDILKSAAVDSENMDDYVNLFIDMDRANGLEYNQNMLNPYEALFSGYDKEAVKKAANSYVLVSEAPVPLEEFTKIAKDKIEKNFTANTKEEFLEVVKLAQEKGGIAASQKLIEFPSETQRQLLNALIQD
jgi:hypothetical protein